MDNQIEPTQLHFSKTKLIAIIVLIGIVPALAFYIGVKYKQTQSMLDKTEIVSANSNYTWVNSTTTSPQEIDPVALALTETIYAGGSCVDSQNYLDIHDIKYFDFTGDNIEEIIVRASSCEAKTSTPDINAVYKLSGIGTLEEIPFEISTSTEGIESEGLTLEGERVVETFKKGTLKIYYMYKDGTFVIDLIEESNK